MALSLFKNFKGKDYKFIDDIVKQQFNIGGTLILVHKYLGPQIQGNAEDSTQPIQNDINELNIQDILFMENRDRKYDNDIIELKGHYLVSDLEFNLSQFGLMLNSNSLYISFHTNSMVERLGRKLIAGDVLELVHKRDDLLLDEEKEAINCFMVVTDASRSAEGYSPTWLSHIWRVNVSPMKDTQEVADILNQQDDNGNALRDLLSTFNKTTEISDAIADQANSEVSSRNFNSSHLYIKDGNPSDNLQPWIFNGDLIPPNTNIIANSGRRFPTNPNNLDYFIRTDYNPARLFQRQDNRWKVIEANFREKYSSSHKILADALDNTAIESFGPTPDDQIASNQPLSTVISPKSPPPDSGVNNDPSIDFDGII